MPHGTVTSGQGGATCPLMFTWSSQSQLGVCLQILVLPQPSCMTPGCHITSLLVSTL